MCSVQLNVSVCHACHFSFTCLDGVSAPISTQKPHSVRGREAGGSFFIMTCHEAAVKMFLGMGAARKTGATPQHHGGFVLQTLPLSLRVCVCVCLCVYMCICVLCTSGCCIGTDTCVLLPYMELLSICTASVSAAHITGLSAYHRPALMK